MTCRSGSLRAHRGIFFHLTPTVVANQLGEIGQIAVQLRGPSDQNRTGRHRLTVDHAEQLNRIDDAALHQLIGQGGKYNPGMDTAQIIEAIDTEIQRLQAAKALLGGSPTSKPAAKPSPKPGRRKMSAAGRTRIVAAQKARWAKVKAGK